MPLHITDPEADRLARELAASTGQSISDAVIAALRERLDRIRQPGFEQRLACALEIAHAAASLIDTRRPEADDLYDEHGMPA
jgi:antitoxin VapB